MFLKVVFTIGSVSLATACVEPTSIIIEPLRIINWSPASGAYCVDPLAVVMATFSDDLVAGSVRDDTFVLRDGDTAVAGELEYDSGSYSIILTPSAPLAFDRQYSAVATPDIEGQARGRLAVELTASFATISRSGCTPPVDCEAPACCTLSSECPGNQICVNRTCVPECSEDKDCFRGTCQAGTCVPDSAADGGGGDPGPGDVGPGDVGPGDVGPGDVGPGDVGPGDVGPGDSGGDA